MAMVPVKRTADWEVRIFGRGIGTVSDERVDKINVGRKPSWIQVSNDGSGVYEISPVETVDVVRVRSFISRY